MKIITNENKGKVISKVFGMIVTSVMGTVFFSSVFLSNVNASENNDNNYIPYQVQLPLQKMNKINKALKYKQYINDLSTLNSIIKELNSDPIFYKASTSIEMNLKNANDLYTVDFLKNLAKVLNGVSPYNSEKLLDLGYLKEVKEDFADNYSPYLEGMYMGKKVSKFEMNNVLLIRKKIIEKKLEKLHKVYKEGKDESKILQSIYKELILSLTEVKNECDELEKAGVIKPFTKEEDNKYKMPENWAQPDGKTTLGVLINFVLGGDHKHGLHGIKDYFNVVKKLPKFIILK